MTDCNLTNDHDNHSRTTPYEWANPHPCNDEADELEYDMNLHNCLWHNWGSLMQQGSDICPRYILKNKTEKLLLLLSCLLRMNHL